MKLIGGALVALAISFIVADIFFPLEPFGIKKPISPVVYAKNGEVLRAFPDKNGIWRFATSPDEVSKDYLDALLHYEDRYFYYHFGVNPQSLVRALLQWLHSGEIVSGGSTITMQVARLLYPHSRTVQGKAYQIFRAIQLELHYSKKEILNMYLNAAPFGGTFEGVATASYQYFRKLPKDLTAAESALLAVLPQSPSRFRPDKYPDKAKKAKNKVLDRLLAFGVWSKEKVEAAKLEPIAAYPADHNYIAPLYSERLIKQDQSKKHIHTDIDANLQREVEQLASDYIYALPDKVTAALQISDLKSGAVIAYIGNAAYANMDKSGYVDIIPARRSPGSTLKPLLYAYALNDGVIHSSSMLLDTPIKSGEYRPTNFNGLFSGPVAAEHALQRSLNAPVIRLLEEYGARKFEDDLRAFGVPLTHTTDGSANVSTILGGQSSSLELLHKAYLNLARLAFGQQDSFANLKSEAAWVTSKILSLTPIPKSMRRLSPQVNGQIAWKTGTSYGFRDSWTIGFNRDYVVSVWVGDPSGAAVPGLSGLKSAAPLFFRVMRLLKVKTSFPDAPSSVTRQIICWPLGRLASNTEPSHCHIQRQAWIINDHVPPTRMKTRNRNPLPILVDDVSNKRGDISCLRDKKKVIEIALWPQEVDAWINKRYRISEQLPPLLEGCTDHLSHLNMPQIEGVGDGDLLSLGKDKSRMLTLTNSLNLPVHWYVNGELKSSGSLSFSLALESNRDYQIVIMDSYGNMDKKQFSVFAPLM